MDLNKQIEYCLSMNCLYCKGGNFEECEHFNLKLEARKHNNNLKIHRYEKSDINEFWEDWKE